MELYEDHEEAQALPWYEQLRKTIDNIMDEGSGVSTRIQHREVCGVLHKTLPAHGGLRKLISHGLVQVNLVWTATNKKPIAFEKLLLTLGIIPSDPLYRVVRSYFYAVLPEEVTE